MLQEFAGHEGIFHEKCERPKKAVNPSSYIIRNALTTLFVIVQHKNPN
jgi:hypothetical protein